MLGENTTLDEFRGDLNRMERIPNTGIEVSWELDNYEVMNLMGELNEDNLREEGTLVGLRALLSYEGEEAVHSFCAKVFPPAISAEEKRVRELAQQIQKEEADSREKAYLTLPDESDGKRLSCQCAGDSRA